MGLEVQSANLQVPGCACRELRARGVQVTRSAGSDLIVALCRAEQPDQALAVYQVTK